MSSYYEKFIATGEVKCIDEEIPFEIPSSWEWCRLLSIVSLLGDGIHGTPEYSEGGSVYFINGNNLFDGKILIKPDTKRVSKEEAVKHSRLLNESTVLVSINGTIGNIAFYSGENIILGKSACYFNLLNGIEKKYIMIVLQTDYFLEYAKRVATGSTIKNVPLSGMRNFLIPIPPEDEQQDIIDKLLSLKLLIEKFNVEQLQLDKLNAELRPVLRKSILQEAIQGKLVPQITEEGTAQDLLEQIQQEKWKLAKEGKIKKSALTDSVIYKGDDNKYWEKVGNEVTCIDDIIPFEIPDSWCWIRHNDIFEISGGSQPPKSHFSDTPRDGYIRLYQIRDYGKNPVPVYIPIKEVNKTTIKGDIILARYGASLGKVFWAEDGAYNVAMAKVVPFYASNLICKEFIFLFYCSNIYQNAVKDHSRCAQAGFNKDDLSELFFPLPPYEEQIRIIRKYKEAVASIMSRQMAK